METNSFNSTAISLSDYGMEDLVYELNRASARLAREVADDFEVRDPVRPAMSPAFWDRPTAPRHCHPTSTIPDSGVSALTSSSATYSEALRGLLDGGADLLLVETIFDTLNAKAALFAIDTHFASSGERVPVMISGTITDASGRTLSGQTTEAFWNSVAHAPPADGGSQLRAGRKGTAAVCAGALPGVARPSSAPIPMPVFQTSSGSTMKAPSTWPTSWGVRRERAGQPGGRLLWYHAGTHQGDRGGSEGRSAAPSRSSAARIAG